MSIDRNFNLHSSLIPSTTDGMNVFYKPSFTYVDSGLSCDTFNILHILNGSAFQADEFANALDHYRKQKLQFCVWSCKEQLTNQILEIIKLHGLQSKDPEPGMELDLNEYKIINSNLHQNILISSAIHHVEDFSKVIASNWSPPDENVIEYYRKTAIHFLTLSNSIQLLVYYKDGKPVSTLEMFQLAEESMGIYSLATIENARGKGIGTAMMTFALNLSKSLGFKTAVLQASQDGLRIYERLGFKQVTTYYEFN